MTVIMAAKIAVEVRRRILWLERALLVVAASLLMVEFSFSSFLLFYKADTWSRSTRYFSKLIPSFGGMLSFIVSAMLW